MSVPLACTLALLAASAPAAVAAETDPGEQTYRGRVVDAADKPLAAAAVRLYGLRYEASGEMVADALGEAETGEDGAFTFQVDPDPHRHAVLVLVRKEGLALGWDSFWRYEWKDENVATIALVQPGTVAGTVVDETGKPIRGATVRAVIAGLQGPRDHDWVMGVDGMARLIARTGADGRFAFTEIPADGRADFVAEAPGRVTVFTLTRKSGPAALHIAPGTTDVRIAMPPEAVIEGTVVEKDTGKPVAGVRVSARVARSATPLGRPVAVTDSGGRFRFDRLPAAGVTLMMEDERGQKDVWLADRVVVGTTAGKTTGDVRIEAVRGGIVEVTVREAGSGKPVEGAYVGLQSSDPARRYGDGTDADGVARIHALPGEYRVTNVSLQGYVGEGTLGQVTVTPGKTTHLMYKVRASRIRGTVRDPDGKPVADAGVLVLPHSRGSRSATDAEGRFEAPLAQGFGEGDETRVVIFRHVERNLAHLLDLSGRTEPPKEPLQVTLQPGCTLWGRINGPKGKPLPGAMVHVLLQTVRWGSTVGKPVHTDAQGRYEVTALPRWNRYNVMATGESHGQGNAYVDLAGAKPGAVVEADTLALVLADMTITGVILDQQGKPVANAWVSAYDQQQPHRDVRSGPDGKFTREGIVHGKVRLNARDPEGRGYVRAEVAGGSSDVRLVLAPRQPVGPVRPAEPPSLVGGSVPPLASLHLPEGAAPPEGKRVLVCFWNWEQRPSRHAVNELAKRAPDLAKRNVAVVLVHAPTENETRVRAWLARRKVSIPCGLVAKDESGGPTQATPFRWGVRRWPWLVLTDPKGVATAEGFLLRDLDAALAGGKD
jgi:hypothetical protein